ncbi:MAG TPA: TonB-dependent receptor [Pseudomonadales bacterium]
MSSLQGIRAAWFIVLCALAGAAAPVSAESTGSRSSATIPLRSALKSLQDAGLNVVFSSTLIKPNYRVAPPPATGSLPARARALLAPFGLGLQQIGNDVWYVVRRTPAPAQQVVAALPAAEEAATEDTVEEVVVSVAREPASGPGGRRRLDRDELAATPAIGRDVLRAIAHRGGQAHVGLSARGHLRGGDTNEVLYLIDGIEVIEPFHMGDFHALFSAINPGLVEAVNVYQAGFPATFGSRLSGVIDMELAEPEKPMEGRVDLDFISAASHAQGTLGDARWLVSARRSTVDHLLASLEQDYGRPRFHDELVRLAWQGEEGDVSLGMLYGADELALEDGTAGETAFADYDNALAWIRGSRVLGPGVELRLAGSFTSVENERWGSLNDPANAVGKLWESRDFNVLSLRSAVRWETDERWSLDVGLEGQHQAGEFAVAVDSRYGPLGDPLQPVEHLLRDVRSDRQGTLLTGFVSLERKLNAAWTLELGARYDLQDLDPLHDNQFSPRLQLSYDRGGVWRAYLNAGRYAQHQNLYELQIDDGLVELNAPQIADQFSVGAQWQFGRWQLDAEAYWRDIASPWSRFENLYNRWVLLPELHADRIALAPERARTYGSEITLEHLTTDRLRWALAWSVARARERFGNVWRPRPWEQRQTLRASLDWRPGAWLIGLRATYHTGWPTTSRVTEPIRDFGRLYDTELADYFSLDVHAARRFELPASEVEVYFSLSNVTFAENVGGYRYEFESGRALADERLLLPAVPMLGLSWVW